MKTSKALLLSLFLIAAMQLPAQVDSRNRAPETVVADGLAQLPASKHNTYTTVMSELASTGEKGVGIIANMYSSATDDKTATFEYALNGLTDYVLSSDNKQGTAGLRKGLAKAVDACKDNARKAYLLSLLGRCATSEEVVQIESYLSDAYLSDYAVRALAAIPGIDNEMTALVKAGGAPKSALANIAYQRALKQTEPTLIAWTDGADDETRAAIYNALITCGGSQSIQLLASAAKKAGFQPDKTGAVEAYIRLLENSAPDAATLQQAAKGLIGSKVPAMRCAGLRFLLAASADNASQNVIKALKDKDIEYRNTALDYASQNCKETIYADVAKAFGKLSRDAKLDVVRWFGNNKAADGADAVAYCTKWNDKEMATAAIEAASKIGGAKCQEALIGQLSGENAKEAKAALCSFKGDISRAVLSALASGEKQKVINGLSVASQRHINSLYGDVKGLTASADSDIRQAAYKALEGIANENNFADLCSMLNKADAATAPSLQRAAAKSIASLDSDKQYALTAEAMKQSAAPSLYYPLLAQAGNDNAIATLKQQNNEAANDAMLHVDNSAILPTLLTMAETNSAKKDEILGRYLQLAQAAKVNPTERYIILRSGADLKPSAMLLGKYISALGNTRTVQALAYMRNFDNDTQLTDNVAAAVKEIVAHNAALNAGTDVKQMLEKAKAAYAAHKDNADAGYAVDEITGLQAKTAVEGYELGTNNNTYGANAIHIAKPMAENFEMAFDWNCEGTMLVVVRGMPILMIDRNKGVSLNTIDWKTFSSLGNWNTANVKVVDDRIFVAVNGNQLITNAVMENFMDGEPIRATGTVSIQTKANGYSLRQVCFNTLPSTPISTLSDEEAKQGFELLFDGRSLAKWQGNTTNYMPQDGNIYVTASYGGNGNLYTKKTYSDFVYRFEFCFVQPGVNNGIGLRTHIGTDAAYDGMEIQVLDHDDPIYKGLHDYQQHGSVYGIIVPKHVTFGKLGTWNTEEIRAVGDHITVTVNGEVVLDGNIREACQGHNVAPDGSEHNPYTVDKRNHPGLFNKEGYVSFCGHGPGVKFRNVRILDLSKKKSKRK